MFQQFDIAFLLQKQKIHIFGKQLLGYFLLSALVLYSVYLLS